MQILNDINKALYASSTTELDNAFFDLVNQLFEIETSEIEAIAKDIGDEVNYLHECEAEDNYRYQSYESIYGCPARL